MSDHSNAAAFYFNLCPHDSSSSTRSLKSFMARTCLAVPIGLGSVLFLLFFPFFFLFKQTYLARISRTKFRMLHSILSVNGRLVSSRLVSLSFCPLPFFFLFFSSFLSGFHGEEGRSRVPFKERLSNLSVNEATCLEMNSRAR